MRELDGVSNVVEVMLYQGKQGFPLISVSMEACLIAILATLFMLFDT